LPASMELLALLSGLAAGVSLGLTGGGGSILGVPLLVYVVGLSPHLAIGSSLVAVGVTALLSTLRYFRAGHVRVLTALLMASTGFPGVYLGSLANKHVRGPVLLVIFALFMIAIGAGMVRDTSRGRSGRSNGAPGGSGSGASGYAKVLSAGFIVGLLSGFMGVGGGFLIVPSLVWGLGLSMRDAVGTSLLVIFFNGLAGLASYALQGRPLDLAITGFFVVGGALGGYAGASLAGRLSERSLRLAFALLVFSIAAYMLAANAGRAF